MVRFRAEEWRRSSGSPHTRGDGPYEERRFQRSPQFSPHAWGWSGAPPQFHSALLVLPTRVGMVRFPLVMTCIWSSSPHTRGDGPVAEPDRAGDIWFSPHAWGWSVIDAFYREVCAVLPTRVGMVPKHRQRTMAQSCSPHTRGDGPFAIAQPSCAEAFSPHAWGWSAWQTTGRFPFDVLPTRVGMVR